MKNPRNVIPFRKDPDPEPATAAQAPQVLGVMHREDFELWVCRSEGGAVSLKWWRWGGDQKKFFPLEDGQLTLDSAELEPLAGLLRSVSQALEKKQQNS
jgi:hypothetical protein